MAKLKKIPTSVIVIIFIIVVGVIAMFSIVYFSTPAPIEYHEAQHAKNIHWKCEKLYEYLVPPMHLRNVIDSKAVVITQEDDDTVVDASIICLKTDWKLAVEYSKIVIDADKSHSKFMDNYKASK